MTLAAMPKFEEYGVAMVVETSSAATVTKRGNPWIFRISPPSEMEALGLEQYVDRLGVKRADFLAVNTDWGRGAIAAFGDMLKKKGVAVGAAEYMDQAATDDRKSTCLNSSHITISYAVFCLKKKTTHQPKH